MIRYGILGAARIARAFAREHPRNGKIEAIASRDLSKAQEFASEFNIKNAYGSYDEFLMDRDIDAVYIPLPHHMHHEFTIRCAEAGKHILCEKPAALSVPEMMEMHDACRANGVYFMEAFVNRHLPVHQRVKSLVEEGTIGTLRHIDHHFCIDLKERIKGTFRDDKRVGGGALFDLGVYGINIARYLTGCEPKVESAFCMRSDPDAVDDFTSVVLRFSDITTNVTCSVLSFAHYYTVSGEKGSIHIPTGNTGHFVENRLEIQMQGDHEVRVETFSPVNGYRAEAEYFADCILRNESPEYGGEDSLKQVQVIEEIWRKEKTVLRTPT